MKENEYLNEKILSLVAYSGETRADSLARLNGGRSYKRQLLSELESINYVKKYIFNDIKCYRLTNRSKKMLVSKNPRRFSLVFDSWVKSEAHRRIRLHTISETLVSMLNTGVEIFVDKKMDIFGNCYQKDRLVVPAYYTSADVRRLEDRNFLNSKFTGLLFTRENIFFVYNAGDGYNNWYPNSEMKMMAGIKGFIENSKLRGVFNAECFHAVVFGRNYDTAVKLLTEKKNYFLLQQSCSFFFIPFDGTGDSLLRILCAPKLQQSLNQFIFGMFEKTMPDYAIDCDGTLEGAPVLVSYIIDLPRLNRFLYALRYYNKSGIVFCFDIQEPFFLKLRHKLLELKTISYANFERSFLRDG